VVAYEEHLSTANHWRKAAKQAKRLSTEKGLCKKYAKEHRYTKKKKTRYRNKASSYKEVAKIFSQGTRQCGTVKQQDLARNAPSCTKSAQKSKGQAEESIKKSSADLRRLGIDFEAEEAARRGAKEAAKEAVALDGLLSLHAGLHP